MIRFIALRLRARAALGLLVLSLITSALSPSLAEAKGHGQKPGKHEPTSHAQAVPVVAPPAAKPVAKPGKPGKDPNQGSAGAGPGNGPGNGQATPGHDHGKPGGGQPKPAPGPKPGKDDPATSKPDQGASSTPAADSGNRPAATPALPVVVPAAAAPVATPQGKSGTTTKARKRSSARAKSRAKRRAAARARGGSAAAAILGAATFGGNGATTFGPASPTAGSGPVANTDFAGAAKKPKKSAAPDTESPVTRTVTRTVRDIVKVVPKSAKMALAALAALAVLFGTGYLLMALRARRLGRQRRELLQEVGLLQGALLPAVPATIGALRTSVAYRPADGPGAGGDFYDVLPLAAGRVGFILGDVSGHGHEALQRTAFMRYTLRAYLEAGLEPRVALQVAGRVIDDNLGGDFATVLLAVHDPNSGTLTYASAGHPGPIVIGNGREHEPVTAASSPPIGIGERTGLRQTTVPLTHGSVACLFTDGLTESRTEDGILGRWRLQKLLKELGPGAEAEQLLEKVASVARVTSDDMATCLIAPAAGATAGGFQTEQLELSSRELDSPLAMTFMSACAVPEAETARALHEAKLVAGQFGGVVLHVVLGNRRTVEVLPRNVESIEASSLSVTAAG